MSVSSGSAYMPDAAEWERVQESYIKAVKRGRHPTSFKRRGELWYHVQNTGRRIDRVSKGHKLIKVLDEGIPDDWAEGDELDNDDYSLAGSETADMRSRATPLQNARTPTPKKPSTSPHKKIIPNMSEDDASLIDSVLGGGSKGGIGLFSPMVNKTKNPEKKKTGKGRNDHLIDFSMNGLHIDVRDVTPVNYGQIIVLMNDANECICLDRKDNMRIKSAAQLKPSDSICWKLTDLRETTNPSEIRYGDPIWLQVVKMQDQGSGNGAAVTDFFSGQILGTKIFSLATISTQQLDSAWLANEKREAIMKAEEEVDSDEEYDRRMEEKERKENEARKAKEALDKPKSKKGWGALRSKKSGLGLMTNMAKKLETERKKKADEEKRLRRGKEEEEEEEQTSGEKALIGEVCGQALAVNLAHNTMGRDIFGEGASEVTSRQAMNLGMFIPQSAEGAEAAAARVHYELVKNDRNNLDVKELPPAGNGCVVHTNRPIYIAQDMYCLSNSLGSSFRQWPRRADEFCKEFSQEDEIGAEGGHHAHGSDHMGQGLGGGGLEGGINGGNSRAGTKVEKAKSRGRKRARVRDPEGEHGVMRKIVMRDKEYPFAVDRKCVWHFCHVDMLVVTGGSGQVSLQEFRGLFYTVGILYYAEWRWTALLFFNHTL